MRPGDGNTWEGGAPAVPLMTTDYDVRVVASFKQHAGALRSGPAQPRMPTLTALTLVMSARPAELETLL